MDIELQQIAPKWRGEQQWRLNGGSNE